MAVALAAIGSGIAFAVLVGNRPVPAVGTLTSPSPSASVSASVLASASVEPTVTQVPTPTPNPQLANRAIADVIVDQLNVRAAAGESAEILGQLRAGARVFTIGEPESSAGTYWYRVAVASGPYSESTCHPDAYDCIEAIGWVASPINDDPWLEEVDLGCASSPMTIEDLAQLTPLERLHCYGSNDIFVTGTIDTPCCGYVGPVLFEPTWLAQPGGAFFHEGGLINYRSDPTAGLASPERGDLIRATAHFDDPASASCRTSVEPAYALDEIAPDLLAPPAEVVLHCRTSLVISDYEVLESDTLGPCECGFMPDGAEIANRRLSDLG